MAALELAQPLTLMNAQALVRLYAATNSAEYELGGRRRLAGTSTSSSAVARSLAPARRLLANVRWLATRGEESAKA